MGVRRQDGDFSKPCSRSELWPARNASPHSKMGSCKKFCLIDKNLTDKLIRGGLIGTLSVLILFCIKPGNLTRKGR